ncbi:hypothetical protein FWH09_01435 [Candidatus Saccharibacteria bacterium]|nr:hypothetical protein [Candidatus Saccharibacteria bacterium]
MNGGENLEVEKRDEISLEADGENETFPVPGKPKWSKKKKLIVFGVVGIVVIVAALLTLVFVMRQDDADDNRNDDQSEEQDDDFEQDISDSEDVDPMEWDTRMTMANLAMVWREEMRERQGFVEVRTDRMVATLPGYDFFTEVPADVFSLTLPASAMDDWSGTSGLITTLNGEIADAFDGWGFERIAFESAGGSDSVSFAMANDVVVCTVMSGGYSDGARTYLVQVGCTAQETAAISMNELGAFAMAYGVASGSNVVISLPSIEDSSISGYQVARGFVGGFGMPGGAAALFYRAPGGVWRFFKATQNILLCTDYATDDVRRAFADDECLVNADGSEMETAKVGEFYELF